MFAPCQIGMKNCLSASMRRILRRNLCAGKCLLRTAKRLRVLGKRRAGRGISGGAGRAAVALIIRRSGVDGALHEKRQLAYHCSRHNSLSNYRGAYIGRRISAYAPSC